MRRIFGVFAALALLGALSGAVSAQDVQFIRGDSNVDGDVDISDGVFTLIYQFSGGGLVLHCEDAADANDDEQVDISDAIFTLEFLFTGGPEPGIPFHSRGCDPVGDALSCASYRENVPCGAADSMIIGHTFTDLAGIPADMVQVAKTSFRIWYGHTSHGSQIMSGIEAMRDSLYNYNQGAGTLSIVEPGSGDLGNPDTVTWAQETRAQLDEAGNDRNVVMWSWCGQVSSIFEETLQQDYLDQMNELEAQYPGVRFIYMTGHLDGSGVGGNLNQRNEQIRAFCRANDKILFDFADIESFDPDGAGYLDRGANDNCDYDDGGTTRNWATEWCDRNPGKCSSCDCAHSQSLNCDRKARAFWWMMAKMAAALNP